MPRPRVHDDDTVLDAAAAVVLERGPRGASIAAIAQRAGAPTGSLYHRFGSRDGLLAALWLRCVGRFQAGVAAAAAQHDALEAGVAVATWVVDFVCEHPDDARLLLQLRREDLLDGAPPEDLEAINRPGVEALRSLAHRLGLRPEWVAHAVVDLPYGAVRRHLARNDGPLPAALRRDVGLAARTLLTTTAQETRP